MKNFILSYGGLILVCISISVSVNANNLLDKTTIEQQLQQPVLKNGEILTLEKNDKKVTLNNCVNYLKYKQQGYYPANTVETVKSSHFIKTCNTLNFIKQAKPAKHRYLQHFKLARDYTALPASIVFTWLGEQKKPQGLVLQAFPDTQTQASPINKGIILTSQQAGLKSALQILARGDYNHDGNEDILLLVANYVLNASFRSYETVVITKSSPHGIIHRIDLGPTHSKGEKPCNNSCK